MGRSAVAEVGRLPKLTRVPGTPEWLSGVANWRGRILAVLDVRPLLGAAILTLLPEMLRSLRDFRLVVNGLILVVIVLFLPKGIWDPQRYRQWFSRRAKPAQQRG